LKLLNILVQNYSIIFNSESQIYEYFNESEHEVFYSSLKTLDLILNQQPNFWIDDKISSKILRQINDPVAL